VSLRLRLLLAVGAVAMLALGAADVATYSALRSFLYQRVDTSLDAAHLAVEHGPLQQAAVDRSAPGTFVELRGPADNVEGSVILSHQTGDHLLTPKLPTHIGGLTAGDGPGEPRTYFTTGSMEPGGPQFRVRASTLSDGSQLIVAVSLHDTTLTLHQLLAIELAVTAAALVAAAGLGWWLVQVGLRPLADVKRTAAAIAEGELDRRVPGDGADTEVGQVARALNTMLGRIESAFAERDATEARLRRFVADASHELRTPLTAVAAYAEMFDRGASVRPDDLARVMTGIQAETGRMGRLVEDLLLLARLDEGQPLERRPVEVVGLAAEAIETATAVGPDWPVRLHADHPVEVVGDAARLRQVVDNLLANVRAHTPPGTTALVRVAADADDAVLEVADNGPGLTDEQASRVFERFYRADPSRSRQRGGAGLGLGIVASIVAAHGGRVAASSSLSGGAVFTVRLPLAGTADHAMANGSSPSADP
jgi:two-component system OmpR family sensor kinase